MINYSVTSYVMISCAMESYALTYYVITSNAMVSYAITIQHYKIGLQIVTMDQITINTSLNKLQFTTMLNLIVLSFVVHQGICSQLFSIFYHEEMATLHEYKKHYSQGIRWTLQGHLRRDL